MTAAASPFAQAHETLTGLGYSCVPIMDPAAAHKSAGKVPARYISGGWQAFDGWTDLRTTPLSGFALGMALKAPRGNVGLVMGTPAGHDADGTPLFTMSIDIDTEDPDAFDDIVRSIPASPMRTQGAKGWKAFYRAPATIRSRGFDDARIPKGQGLPRRLVDVLTGFDTRQAVVAPSQHPSGVTYVWLGDGPVAATALPIFDEGDYERLVETLMQHGYDPDAARQGRGERKPYVPAEHDGGDIFAEVKAAALANLGAWVHDVPGLYGLRPARGGFECVNTLRDSSSGQPLERRKRNLSIQANGIRDFGSDDTWSAIDLVSDFCRLSISEAVTWLTDRLPGFDDSDVVIDLSGMIAANADPEADLPWPLRETAVAPQSKSAPTSVGADAEADLSRGGADATVSDIQPGATHDVETELPAHLCKVPGLLGDIAEWITATARKPQPSLALAMAIGLVGTVAGRKFCGPTQSATHLFMLCTGPTGSGKNAPKKAAQQLLAAAGLNGYIGPSSFQSASALIQHVAQRPASLCVMDEFSGFIGKLNAKNNSTHERAISTEMRQFWTLSFETYEPPRWAASRDRMQPEPIISPALSLIGLTTADELYTVLQGADVLSGFLNRFTLVATLNNPQDVEPSASVFDPPAALVEGLQAIANVGGVMAQATMHNLRPDRPLVSVPWDDGSGGFAHRTFKALVATLAEMTEHEALTQRCAEMAVRLATIRAIGIGGEHARVTVDDMQWGADFALWSTRRLIADVEAHMSESEWQAKAKFVLRCITDAPGRRIGRSALCKRVNHRFPARELDAIIKGLIETGEVVEISSRAAGNSSRTSRPGPAALTYFAP